MNNMDQFKLKKIKITKTEKIIIVILTIMVSVVYFIVPVNLKDKEVEYKTHNIKNVLQKFIFDGQEQVKTVFENTYANVVYLNKGIVESHFINLETEKEIEFNDFIKDDKEDNFFNKIRELLLLKYPQKIVNILVNEAKKTYVFHEYYLSIEYDIANLLDTSRLFNLKVYYNEIVDYLEFKPIVSEESEVETGFSYDPSKVSVAFSFDDGPNGNKTQRLIDALEDYKMSATFFFVANKMDNDKITVKKVYDSHSEIGYHSYRHEYFTKQSTEEIKAEFAKSDSILNQITGGHFKLSRPPYGAYNKNVLNAIDNAFIRWNLDTNDWQFKDPEYIRKYVLDNLSDNSIILFHDSYNTSVEAAITLMETLYLMDVQVLSVSELAKLRNIELSNHEVYYDFK